MMVNVNTTYPHTHASRGRRSSSCTSRSSKTRGAGGAAAAHAWLIDPPAVLAQLLLPSQGHRAPWRVQHGAVRFVPCSVPRHLHGEVPAGNSVCVRVRVCVRAHERGKIAWTGARSPPAWAGEPPHARRGGGRPCACICGTGRASGGKHPSPGVQLERAQPLTVCRACLPCTRETCPP